MNKLILEFERNKKVQEPKCRFFYFFKGFEEMCIDNHTFYFNAYSNRVLAVKNDDWFVFDKNLFTPFGKDSDIYNCLKKYFKIKISVHTMFSFGTPFFFFETQCKRCLPKRFLNYSLSDVKKYMLSDVKKYKNEKNSNRNTIL